LGIGIIDTLDLFKVDFVSTDGGNGSGKTVGMGLGPAAIIFGLGCRMTPTLIFRQALAAVVVSAAAVVVSPAAAVVVARALGHKPAPGRRTSVMAKSQSEDLTDFHGFIFSFFSGSLQILDLQGR